MNKQHRYLSLILLAGVYSGACAMESDTPNQEDKKDNVALLKPEFNKKQRSALRCIMKSDDFEAAYDAALRLEIDLHPNKRNKNIIKSRKQLWEDIKETSVDRDAALRKVNYLTGSEEETEGVEGANPFEAIANRVQRRNAQLIAQANRKAELSAQVAQLKNEEAQRQMQLGKIAAVIRATENNSLADISTIENKANNEIAQLEERIKAISAQRDQEISTREQQCEVTVSLHSKELNNVRSKQGKNVVSQAELEKLLQKLDKAKALPKKDKAKLLAYLATEIEEEVGFKEGLEKEVAQIKSDIAEETVDVKIDNMRSSLQNKEKELANSKAVLAQLNVASAKANGTYSTWTNFRGGYKQ